MPQVVKNKLPRRESERRIHPLSQHHDILESVYNRIGILKITFRHHLIEDLFFFFPGKIIDEIFAVLWTVMKNINQTSALPPTYEILTELRDITSMAMEVKTAALDT